MVKLVEFREVDNLFKPVVKEVKYVRWNDLKTSKKSSFIEMHRTTLYYKYAKASYANYLNGLQSYNEYVESLYSEQAFINYCNIYLSDMEVLR